MAKVSQQDIIDSLKEMTMIEVADLVKQIEETFGVSAATVQYAAPAGQGGAQGASAEVEEKTKFDVVLTESGGQKIAVIKAIRDILPELGLKEAKDLVDSAPKVVKEGISKEDATKAKESLEKAGAKVEIK